MILPRGKRVFHRSSGLNMAVHIECIHKSFSGSIFLSPPSENVLLSLCFPAFQACFFFLSAHCFVVPGTFTVGPHSVLLIYLMFCAIFFSFFFFTTLCWSTYASQGSWFTKNNQTALKKWMWGNMFFFTRSVNLSTAVPGTGGWSRFSRCGIRKSCSGLLGAVSWWEDPRRSCLRWPFLLL